MVRTPGLYPGYGARLAHSVGSSPAGGTILVFGTVAQLVEQETFNLLVVGSSPTGLTKHDPRCTADQRMKVAPRGDSDRSLVDCPGELVYVDNLNQ